MTYKKLNISRKNFIRIIFTTFLMILGIVSYLSGDFLATIFKNKKKSEEKNMVISSGNKYVLPIPMFDSNVSIEEAIAWRRSIREYEDEPILIEQLSKILWASHGINELYFQFRTTPSAGATYPLEIYVIISKHGVLIKNSEYLDPGSYKYDNKNHSIELMKEGKLNEALAKAALNQEWVRLAPINIVICSIYERTERVYGERGKIYAHIENGHVGQNIYLMAAALNLGSVAIGAFYDDEVRNVIGADKIEKPLYIMPIGIPKEPYKIDDESISEYYEEIRQAYRI
jgi:SagB-type dehydrogenase family enzyme